MYYSDKIKSFSKIYFIKKLKLKIMKSEFNVLKRKLYVTIILLTVMHAISWAQGFSPQTTGRLQHIIDSFQSNPANPYVGGMSAAIKVDGLAFWQGATGHAARNVDGDNIPLPGGTSFETSTLSRMYSVTKTFTSALVLELAKEGVFSLEDPVSKYIPFINAVNPELNSAVTIHQLLAHESGYSNYSDEQMLQIAVAFQPTHHWTVFEMLTFVHQVNAPGVVRKYSNTNYLVLGSIIEIATAIPLQQHFRQRFFTPLQLNSIYFDAREPQWPGTMLASPHDNISPFNPIFLLTGQPTFPDAFTNISAFPFTAISTLEFTSGGLISNIADIAEWGNSLFGGRATSQSTLDKMINSISSTPDQDGDFLGYGVFRTTRISATDVFIGHDGSAPGYRSVMFYQPDRKMTITIMTNYRGARLYDVAKALYEALPPFICGNKNKKEDKIMICYNGNDICVDRNAASGLIEKGGYLGVCETVPLTKSNTGQSINENAKLIPTLNLINLYPNPTTGKATISFSTTITGKTKLELYDIQGRLMKILYDGISEKNAQQKIELQTKSFAPGIYIINLQIENKRVGQGKLVVRN
jgi:D-alanyl-D-alanine carboxypeptidase